MAKDAMVHKVDKQAVRFFFKHAGYSVAQGESRQAGRWRSARELARAEQYAQEHEWTFHWEPDCDADLSWMSEAEQREEHECLACVLRDSDGDRSDGVDGTVLASLCGIVDATREYGRVIEAELASEALSDIERAERIEREVSEMQKECYAL